MVSVITKKEAGVFLVYYGLLLLLLPIIIPPWSSSLTLQSEPQSFGFEDGLNEVDKITGSPVIVDWPVATGKKAIECRNGDYIRWDLSKPAKEIDLSFNVMWMKLPIINESFVFSEIIEIDDSGWWQGILTTTLYSGITGYRGWNIWTGIPDGRGGFVSYDVVYALETNRWYNIRITADLKNGIYKLYMDGKEIASIADVVVPEDIYIDFFRLGVTPRGETLFINYYDDLTVSLLSVNEQKESIQDYRSLLVQVSGISMIGVGVFVWWLQKSEKHRDKSNI